MSGNSDPQSRPSHDVHLSVGSREHDDVEGWYLDPYGAHQERWYSAGMPTALVRDHGEVSHDDPPGAPTPVEALLRAPEEGPAPAGDLHRADEEQADPHPYDSRAATDLAMDTAAYIVPWTRKPY